MTFNVVIVIGFLHVEIRVQQPASMICNYTHVGLQVRVEKKCGYLRMYQPLSAKPNLYQFNVSSCVTRLPRDLVVLVITFSKIHVGSLCSQIKKNVSLFSRLYSLDALPPIDKNILAFKTVHYIISLEYTCMRAKKESGEMDLLSKKDLHSNWAFLICSHMV